MPGFHDANPVGLGAMPILHDHQAGVDSRAQPMLKRLRHGRRRLSSTDDDDSLYARERVLMGTDGELVTANANLPGHGFIGIDGLQPCPEEPCKEGFRSWVRDADTHHVN